jgi:antirestriction protein ArdC
MTKSDIYTRVTNQIIEAMERGQASFQMPWHSRTAVHAPTNAKSKRMYRGVNAICLWAAADYCGYESGLWATYQQWKELGAQVRKAEKATEIVFWKSGELKSSQEDDDQPESYFVARGFSVFNAAQVDGFVSSQTLARLFIAWCV